MNKKTIKGKIIRILDERTAIINLGTRDGVKEYSFFQILGEPEAVIDPFTKKELGKVTVLKAKLKTSQVYDKFTIATTRWIQSNIKGLRPFTGILGLMETETIDEGDMRVDHKEIEPWKAQSENTVRVGDVVSVEIDLD